MSETEQRVLQLIADGWRVFAEWDSEHGAVYCLIGLTRHKGLGIEGVAYCEHIGNGATQAEALEAVIAKAAAAGEVVRQ